MISSGAITEEIMRQLSRRSPDSSICPSEVARALQRDEAAWRALMPQVREVAAGLREQGRLRVTRGGVDVAASELHHGPVRLAREARQSRFPRPSKQAMNPTSQSELLVCIRRAFPPRPVPDSTLRQALLADQAMSRCIGENEWEAAKRIDGHIVWPDLSDVDLADCCNGVAHLDETAFAYYLGALLSFGVRYADCDLLQPRGDLLSTVVFSVADRSPYSLSRYERLNESQQACVVAFLRLVAEKSDDHRNDASHALDRYWLLPVAKRQQSTPRIVPP